MGEERMLGQRRVLWCVCVCASVHAERLAPSPQAMRPVSTSRSGTVPGAHEQLLAALASRNAMRAPIRTIRIAADDQRRLYLNVGAQNSASPARDTRRHRLSWTTLGIAVGMIFGVGLLATGLALVIRSAEDLPHAFVLHTPREAMHPPAPPKSPRELDMSPRAPQTLLSTPHANNTATCSSLVAGVIVSLSNDGKCDDEGDGGTALCPVGTDYPDCPPRPVG